MKGRPKITRTITSVPDISGFVPTGDDGKHKDLENVFLNLEEYEALRLSDYEGVTQCEAAEVMGVSRPTFTRIYMRARRKIALALVEGRVVVIMGGKVRLDDSWYDCSQCGAIFQDKAHEGVCALCGSSEIITHHDEEDIKRFNRRAGRGRGRRRRGC